MLTYILGAPVREASKSRTHNWHIIWGQVTVTKQWGAFGSRGSRDKLDACREGSSWCGYSVSFKFVPMSVAESGAMLLIS